MDQPTAEHALRRLEPLVGEWTVEATWPDGTRWPGGGKVTFEWHASGAHLVERGTAELPEAAYDMIHGRFTDDQRKGVFKPEVQVTTDASAQDRLLAYTGRDPSR